jgi:hypothetical protein
MEKNRKVNLQIPAEIDVDPNTWEMAFSGHLPAKRKIHYSPNSWKLTILLNKSIYGLKQSPRECYKLVNSFFL